MTIKDLLNNKTVESSRNYRQNANDYNRHRPVFFGRLVMQTIVAVLIFVVVSYTYNMDNAYQDKVQAAVNWAMKSDGITMPAMGIKPDTTDDSKTLTDDGSLLMILPASGVLEKSFGQADSKGNIASDGVEIASIKEQPVKAAADGTVKSIDKKDNGYYIVIDHGNNVLSIYGGIGEAKISVGETARKGDVIGLVGDVSIYFGVKENGKMVDPFLYLGGPQSVSDDI